MKRLFFCMLPVLFSLPVAAQEQEQWDIQRIDGIAAMVEDDIITFDEIRKEIAPLVPQIRQEAPTQAIFYQNIGLVTREILQNLVDRILIIREFEDAGYQIPDSYLTNRYQDYITREFNGDRTAFLEFLQAQGKTDREFRAELREREIVAFMRQQRLKSPTYVSPMRIEEYYRKHQSQFFEDEAVKLRVIMLAPEGPVTPATLEAEAAQLVDELNRGTPFEELAIKHSDDAQASKGGDWDWVERGELRPALEKIAFALRPGTHSQPITLDEYVYILKVEQKREAGVRDLSDVREQIEQAITAQLARQAQERWLDELRSEAYIKYFLEEARSMPESQPQRIQMSFGNNRNVADG